MLGIGLIVATLKFGIGFFIAIILGIVVTKNKKSILKKSVKSSLFYLLVSFIYVYFSLPAQSLSSLLFNNIVSFLIGMFFVLFMTGTTTKISGSKDKKGTQISFNSPKIIRNSTIIAVLLAIAYFIIIPVGRILSTDEIYETISVKKVTETEELKSTKETPIAMSTKSARNKMQKMMSSVPNYSAYELGTTTAQMIDDEYVYVSALEYRSVWKWNRFKQVPGYFKISATNINAQPEFVEKGMKYVPSGYLWQDAERKIYSKSSNLARTGVVNLEIGEDGTPYYVQTLYKEYGISGKKRYDKFQTAILNAETGETKIYNLKDVPKEIDAPITSSVASSMNSYYGKYGKGWWNSLFAKDDVKQPTSNGIYSSGAVTPLMSKNGELLYFTDFTSDDEKQDSALGYSLINARTGVMEFYRDKKGMMDSDGAIQIAEKIYPEKKWEAKMPILYNIEGMPTWIVSLLDTNGIFKGYVYISATDSDILVDGNDAEKTLQAFKVKLSLKGSNNKNTSKSDAKKVTGKVKRVNKIVIDGTETVSFMLEDDKQVYTISTANNVYSMFLKEGDQVSFEANISSDNPMTTIDDITIEEVTPIN
ncbi:MULTISPECIES: DNA-binding protein [Vagococcus]|uniref:Conserved domain protein n=1 Tax=Vagococcus fluvialis bH819 TaxID=1255619 RepID=A0A1X6WJU0_9ENTE|nr:MULTISPECIES: DNA-binding protein [Vagococcus]SLM84573.1 Conserved domain protein [Vagococcus fluvialis bH819]